MLESAAALMRAARPVALGATAVGLNAGIDSQTDVNLMGTLMFPNPIHSITAGMTIGAVFGKGSFSGAFGYKTLLSGVNGGMSNISAGGLILPAIELGAKGLVKMGASHRFVIAAQNARKMGLAGIATTMEFANERSMKIGQALLGKEGFGLDHSGKRLAEAEWKQAARFEIQAGTGTKQVPWEMKSTDSRPGRSGMEPKKYKKKKLKKFINDAWNASETLHEKTGWKIGAGLAGKDATSMIETGEWVTTKTGGKAVTSSLVSTKKTAAFVMENAKLGAALRWVGVMDMISIGAGVAMWAGGAALDGAAQAISFGIRNFQQAERLELGDRKMSPVFAAPTAATERRRAIQAIYGARVNPAQKMFGNEARYMHR